MILMREVNSQCNESEKHLTVMYEVQDIKILVWCDDGVVSDTAYKIL
jgi:hypothetical protein